MATIDVIFQKELIKPEQIKGKVSVVIDVFLATSTIAVALGYGAKGVIPVRDRIQAIEIAKNLPAESYLFAGESAGKVIPGFLPPWPTRLKDQVKGKILILSTSNGTVAINKASEAKKIYTSSFLNGEHVANQIKEADHNEDIIIICSGSDGSFSLEDFLGAGHFLHHLTKNNHRRHTLTDAAKTALYFYQKHQENCLELLSESEVGQELKEYGLIDEVHYVSKPGFLKVISQFHKLKGGFFPNFT